jgi:hypothetical protein
MVCFLYIATSKYPLEKLNMAFRAAVKQIKPIGDGLSVAGSRIELPTSGL